MEKKVAVINGSPRIGWNTDLLLGEAMRGAQEAGASVEKFELYRLERYTGCISCFGCKAPGHEGRCACQDGLTPVLEAIRGADALIMGTPNYLGEVTSAFRALYERLVFQSITFKREERTYNERSIPVLLIMTSHMPEELYDSMGYDQLLAKYKSNLEQFVGPTKILICGDTRHVSDYEKRGWTFFNAETKQAHFEKAFPLEKEKAFKMGRELLET